MTQRRTKETVYRKERVNKIKSEKTNKNRHIYDTHIDNPRLLTRWEKRFHAHVCRCNMVVLPVSVLFLFSRLTSLKISPLYTCQVTHLDNTHLTCPWVPAIPAQSSARRYWSWRSWGSSPAVKYFLSLNFILISYLCWTSIACRLQEKQTRN